MSDVNAWMVLQSAMQEGTAPKSVSRATVARVARFARPHRRALVGFLGLSTVGAVLGVATPVPAGRVGARVGKLEREAADHNAAMTSQMTERFSAAGAILVKLFGRPTDESAEFGLRAQRVRDIGVRSAMATEVFFRALMLVSGLAQALIYGLGGYMALRGHLAPGTVVTLALLLTRLYAPLTALATARLDVTTALVSFERVFEVLDIEPMITESPRARPVPDGPVSIDFADVWFSYPAADKVSLASLEDVATRDDRHGTDVLRG